MQSENINDLATALAKAQGAMKAATFNKTNPHFKNKYADLAAVIDAIRKPLSDNGLAVTQTPQIREDGFVLVTTLLHASGQWLACEYPLPIGVAPQALGSALTYAKRYSITSLVCIAADDDDDAEGARTAGQTASVPKPTAEPPAQVKPPINPETGEVSPHIIAASDPMAWGQLMVAAVKTAKSDSELNQWLAANEAGLEMLASNAPKVHARVLERAREKAVSLKPLATEDLGPPDFVHIRRQQTK